MRADISRDYVQISTKESSHVDLEPALKEERLD